MYFQVDVWCPACHSRLFLKSRQSAGKLHNCPYCDQLFVVEFDSDTSRYVSLLYLSEESTGETQPEGLLTITERRRIDFTAQGSEHAGDLKVNAGATRRWRGLLKRPGALGIGTALCLLLTIGAYAIAGEYRVWRTSDGRRSRMRMTVIDKNENEVRFKREDNGKEFSFPMSKLSKEDQKHLNGHDPSIWEPEYDNPFDPKPKTEYGKYSTPSYHKSEGKYGKHSTSSHHNSKSKYGTYSTPSHHKSEGKCDKYSTPPHHKSEVKYDKYPGSGLDDNKCKKSGCKSHENKSYKSPTAWPKNRPLKSSDGPVARRSITPPALTEFGDGELLG